MRNIAILLLIGAISSTEALTMQGNNVQKHIAQAKVEKKADVKPSAKAPEPKKEVEKKPTAEEHLQTESSAEKTLTVQIEAVKKPEGATKAEELAAMEEALRKATDQAHKERMALLGNTPAAAALNRVSNGNNALMELKKKQEAQQGALVQQLELEEKQRELEIQQSEELEKKIALAESERE